MTHQFLRRRWPAVWTLCVAAWLMVTAAGSWAQTLVVLSDDTASYQQVADELRAGLKAVRDGRVRVDIMRADRVSGVDDQVLKGYELVVAVGLAAAQAVIDREHGLATPPLTLCLLIPRLAFERLAPTRASGRERRLSAVFIDQPVSRQLDLIRTALRPDARIGVVLGPSSALLQDELRDKARERDLTLKFAEVTEAAGVYRALQTLLPESDVLLPIPDPVAVNASTVYGLLLTSYRAQIPVVGFSEGLVKAGALLGLFSTASQQGKQGAEIASRVLSGDGGLPAPQYPRYFTVRANYSVARSLDVRLADEASLTAAVAARADGGTETSRPRSAVESPILGRAP